MTTLFQKKSRTGCNFWQAKIVLLSLLGHCLVFSIFDRKHLILKFLRPYTLHLFVLSVLLALILPVLLQDGMFMDGIQYACVSRNLAAGDGTFWFPWLNDSWMKSGSPYFME